jgi:hypothetical protein
MRGKLVRTEPEPRMRPLALLVFPLSFVSSAYVPVESMPGWMQAFAEHQPLTYMYDIRGTPLLSGGQLKPPLDPQLGQVGPRFPTTSQRQLD